MLLATAYLWHQHNTDHFIINTDNTTSENLCDSVNSKWHQNTRIILICAADDEKSYYLYMVYTARSTERGEHVLHTNQWEMTKYWKLLMNNISWITGSNNEIRNDNHMVDHAHRQLCLKLHCAFQITHWTVWILWHTTRSWAAFAHCCDIQQHSISMDHPLIHINVLRVQNLHLEIVMTCDIKTSILPEQERVCGGVIKVKGKQVMMAELICFRPWTCSN